MGRGANQAYNIITLVFLTLSGAAIIVFGVLLTQPPPELDADALAAFPTQIVVPTATETLTPSPTLTPQPATFTPTFTPSLTPTQTQTLTPTITLSPTITETTSPTPTDSVTRTPTLTPTTSPSPGPSPTTTPTTSPFLFGADPVQFSANQFNTLGCNWQGVGGQVLNLEGRPYEVQLQVRVVGTTADFDQNVRTGTNSNYGQTGYEVRVSGGVNQAVYFVQLETVNGNAISERLQVEFPSSCEGNLALVTFRQLRAIPGQ